MADVLISRSLSIIDNIEGNIAFFRSRFDYNLSRNKIDKNIIDNEDFNIIKDLRLALENEDKCSNSDNAARISARNLVDRNISLLSARIRVIESKLENANAGLYLTSVLNDIKDNLELTGRLIERSRQVSSKSSAPNQLVPSESPAPIRVVVQDGKLKLASQRKHIGSVPDPSVDRLRQAARAILWSAIDSLNKSGNADPRLALVCNGLYAELSAPLEQMSVEALGLNWQVVTEGLSVTEDTVPDIVLSQLRRVLTTVNVILGQYEEWQIYLTAESGSKLNASEVIALAKQAELISKELECASEIVDQKISVRLQLIIDPISTGIIQMDTIGVPLAGSISNLFAALSHVAINSLPGSPSIAGSVSGAFVLTNFAFMLITKFAPTLAAFPPLSWLKGVREEILKNWSLMKDSIKPS